MRLSVHLNALHYYDVFMLYTCYVTYDVTYAIYVLCNSLCDIRMM